MLYILWSIFSNYCGKEKIFLCLKKIFLFEVKSNVLQLQGIKKDDVTYLTQFGKQV